MPNFQQLNDADKQVTIALYESGQPLRILPARLKAIAMTGARLLVDGPTVPAAGRARRALPGVPHAHPPHQRQGARMRTRPPWGRTPSGSSSARLAGGSHSTRRGISSSTCGDGARGSRRDARSE